MQSTASGSAHSSTPSVKSVISPMTISVAGMDLASLGGSAARISLGSRNVEAVVVKVTSQLIQVEPTIAEVPAKPTSFLSCPHQICTAMPFMKPEITTVGTFRMSGPRPVAPMSAMKHAPSTMTMLQKWSGSGQPSGAYVPSGAVQLSGCVSPQPAGDSVPGASSSARE